MSSVLVADKYKDECLLGFTSDPEVVSRLASLMGVGAERSQEDRTSHYCSKQGDMRSWSSQSLSKPFMACCLFKLGWGCICWLTTLGTGYWHGSPNLAIKIDIKAPC